MGGRLAASPRMPDRRPPWSGQRQPVQGNGAVWRLRWRTSGRSRPYPRWVVLKVDEVEKGTVLVEAGRLELPGQVLEQLQIKPGDYVVLRPEKGQLVIRKAPLALLSRSARKEDRGKRVGLDFSGSF